MDEMFDHELDALPPTVTCVKVEIPQRVTPMAVRLSPEVLDATLVHRRLVDTVTSSALLDVLASAKVGVDDDGA